MGYEAQLAWKGVHAHFFRQAILTGKVGQTGLAFGIRSGFISRSAQAKLQVAVCSGYGLFHPGKRPHKHRQTAFDQLI